MRPTTNRRLATVVRLVATERALAMIARKRREMGDDRIFQGFEQNMIRYELEDLELEMLKER